MNAFSPNMPVQQQQQMPDQTPNGADTANNADDFSLDTANIWADPTPPVQQQPQPVANKSPDQMAAFNQYVSGLQFQGGPTSEMFQQALQTGDFGKVAASFNSMAQEIYKRAMQDASKMYDASIEKSVSTAVGKSKDFYATEQSRQALRQSIPIAANPNVAPVAEAVFGQAMRQHGGDRAKAMKQTQAFFNALSQQPHTAFGFNTPPAGSPSLRRGGGSSSFGGSGEDDFDWVGWSKSNT